MRATILIGVPGAGKSTWLNKMVDEEIDVVISIDNILERMAEDKGLTYDDVWKDNVEAASKAANAKALEAIADNKNIIWDMTNTTKKSRARKLNMLPKGYVKVAVVFPTPPDEELDKRLQARKGKTISKRVLDDMINRLELPDFDEGFDLIQTVEPNHKVLRVKNDSKMDCYIAEDGYFQLV